MSIHASDLNELKRMATNSYDNDRKFLNRVINGINDLEKQASQLRSVIAQLQKENAALEKGTCTTE
jgi:uncharacterized tellurite resistance protein B-like protein